MSLQAVIALGGVGEEFTCPGDLIIEYLVGSEPLRAFYDHGVLCDINILARAFRVLLTEFWGGP